MRFRGDFGFLWTIEDPSMSVAVTNVCVEKADFRKSFEKVNSSWIAYGVICSPTCNCNMPSLVPYPPIVSQST